MQATFETKVRDRSLYPLLDEIADLYGRAERHLYVDRYVRGRPLKELKRAYLVRFGLTARQFNAIRAGLEGKVRAARESAGARAGSLREKIRAAEERIAALERDLRRSDKAGGRKETGEVAAGKRRLRFALHQKKRRLGKLRAELAAAQREAGRAAPGVCFGGKKRFRTQFHLRENGYASHAEWLRDWRAARASHFVCLGSKDETAGNQTATLLPDGGLRLRVPDALVPRFGRWVVIPDVRFRYGQDVIDQALLCGQAITHRFVRRERGWYVQATTERPDAGIVTRRDAGALGVDLNPHLVAVGRIDRHGNPVAAHHLPVLLQGRRRDQVTAALAEAVADIVAWARSEGVPVVVERLDFAEKKARLRETGGPRYARMLSAFAYSRFHALLVSRAAREGVEVIRVNPAYTSVIGQVKFASGYGLSPHTAAAVAIARRGFGFGERLRSRSGSALPLPARNRGRHVWSDWRRVSRRLRAARARGRRPSEGGAGKGMTSIPVGTPAMREGPPGDVRPVPGCDPPAQVGKAVRPASWRM